MSNSESALTPQTAPRSLDALKVLPPFKLRVLAQTLGGVDSAQQKSAWHSLATNEARAAYVLELLIEWDKKNGGPPAAAPAVVEQLAPVAPAMMQLGTIEGSALPAVTQAALAAATAATAEKPKRQPRTSTATEASPPTTSADLGADVLALLTKVATFSEKNADAVGALDRRMVNVLNEQAERIARLETQNGDLQTRLKAMQELQSWLFMSFLTFMQETMNASTPDLIRAAIDDSSRLSELVKQAVGGK